MAPSSVGSAHPEPKTISHVTLGTPPTLSTCVSRGVLVVGKVSGDTESRARAESWQPFDHRWAALGLQKSASRCP
jgi:hypothetical protein